MSQQEYGPTPPRLLDFPDGSQLPTSPDGGTLKAFDSERLTIAIFSDALTHAMARTLILKDRCVEVEVFVEAMDPAGGRLASGSARLQVARIGAGPVTIVGTPLMLTYTPSPPVPPWAFPSVDAQLLADPITNEIFVQVVGLAGVPTRWRTTIKIIGAQAQQVT